MAKKRKKSNGNKGSKAIAEARFLAEKARKLPIYKCYVSENWQSAGIANVIVARERKDGYLCVGMFLCDLWCLGVKDAMGFIKISKEDLKSQILYNEDSKLQECDYNLAHNIVYGAEAFASDADIEPARSFEKWENVLEEDTEDIPLIDIEFGDQGKYHLVAEAGSKEARYARMLQKRLRDDFIFDIGYGLNTFKDEPAYDFDDEPAYDFDDDLDDDLDENKGNGNRYTDLLDNLEDNFTKMIAEDDRHPEPEYSYDRPAYPDTLDIKHPFIAEEFRKPTNLTALPTKVVDRILALPKEEVTEDILKIVHHSIGKTWKGIHDGTLKNQEDTILHSLAFLTQAGDPKGLDAVLEILSQEYDFIDFNLGDAVDMIIPQAIYATGRDQLDRLEEFLRRPGVTTDSKEVVSKSLCLILSKQPERREEIVGIYRRYLQFMLENIPAVNGCSGLLAAFIISDIAENKIEELLPEIKELYDARLVNLNIIGDLKDASKMIKSKRDKASIPEFTDIHDFYREIRETYPS